MTYTFSFLFAHPNFIFWSNIIIIISLSNCFVAYCGSFCDEPTLITGLAGKQVVQIACGSSHSAAVTSEGELYTWGRGNYGRLGHGTVALLKQSDFLYGLEKWFWLVFVICFLSHWMKRTKHGLFIFPPTKTLNNLERALFNWLILLQYDVEAYYQLISRKFSGMKFFTQTFT